MMATRQLLRPVGILFWIAIAVAGYAASRSDDPQSTPLPAALWEYFAGPATTVPAVDPTSRLRSNDPIFLQRPDGQWVQIGFVASVQPADPAQVTLAWHTRQVAPWQCELVHFENRGRLEDVLAIMLPEDKRQQIQQRLTAALSEHGQELAAAFVPLVQQSLQESLPIVEQEFRAAVHRHRGEIDAILNRWNDEIVDQHLIPLARQEILPIIRKHGEPHAEQIGRELWDRASLWRFGWRAVYDKSPLPRKDLVQEEWDRFVQQQVIPVFEAHVDDLVIAIQHIVSDVAANPTVRRELAEVANQIAADPEVQRLVRQLLQETLVNNEQLREVWSEIWDSDQARRALDLAGRRLEPTLREIGDDLFGTQTEGINPDFARVLRNQVLGKDRRWIVARPVSDASQTEPLVIEPALDRMAYPIVYLADHDRDQDEQP